MLLLCQGMQVVTSHLQILKQHANNSLIQSTCNNTIIHLRENRWLISSLWVCSLENQNLYTTFSILLLTTEHKPMKWDKHFTILLINLCGQQLRGTDWRAPYFPDWCVSHLCPMKQVKLVDEMPAVTTNMSRWRKTGIKKAQKTQFKLIPNWNFRKKNFQKYL